MQLSEAEDYGLSEGALEYPEARITVMCRAQTASDAIRLGDAVISALKNVNGAVTVAGSPTVAAILRDPVDSTDYTDEGKVYRLQRAISRLGHAEIASAQI